MKYTTLILLIFCFACSSDDDVPPPKPNSIPDSIKIDEITFEGKNVTIDWSDAKDDDGDQIFYKLYINSILIKESTESIGTSILDYNTDYTGRIIGSDNNGGVTEIVFEFSSPKSKILFFAEANGNLTAYDLVGGGILWQKRTVYTDPVTVYDDVVYTGLQSINGCNILSGELVWSSDPSPRSDEQYRNIVVDEEHVYAVDVGGFLNCSDRISGVKKWRRSFLRVYAPLTFDDEKVYVASRSNDDFYALDKDTGNELWSIDLDFHSTGSGARIESNPLVLGENIYFGDNLGRFFSFNKNSGIKNWSVDVPLFDSFFPSPTFYKNQIITATGVFQGSIYSFDMNTGAQKWKYTAREGAFTTSPFIYQNKIYIGVSGNGGGELICLEAETGQLLWKFDLESNTTSSPIVEGEVVYIGDRSKNLFAINAITGVLDWKLKTDENIVNSPTIVLGDGEIIIYPSNHGSKN